MECLNLRRENPPAVLGAGSEQTPPDTETKSAAPMFKCPIPDKFCISALDPLSFSVSPDLLYSEPLRFRIEPKMNIQ